MLSETDEDAINLHNPDSADTWTTQHTRMAEKPDSAVLRTQKRDTFEGWVNKWVPG